MIVVMESHMLSVICKRRGKTPEVKTTDARHAKKGQVKIMKTTFNENGQMVLAINDTFEQKETQGEMNENNEN